MLSRSCSRLASLPIYHITSSSQLKKFFPFYFPADGQSVETSTSTGREKASFPANVAVDCESRTQLGRFGRIDFCSFNIPGKGILVCDLEAEEKRRQDSREEERPMKEGEHRIIDIVKKLLEDESIQKVFHDPREDCSSLVQLGIFPKNVFDTLTGYWMLLEKERRGRGGHLPHQVPLQYLKSKFLGNSKEKLRTRDGGEEEGGAPTAEQVEGQIKAKIMQKYLEKEGRQQLTEKKNDFFSGDIEDIKRRILEEIDFENNFIENNYGLEKFEKEKESLLLKRWIFYSASGVSPLLEISKHLKQALMDPSGDGVVRRSRRAFQDYPLLNLEKLPKGIQPSDIKKAFHVDAICCAVGGPPGSEEEEEATFIYWKINFGKMIGVSDKRKMKYYLVVF